jgi:hypothetical protein
MPKITSINVEFSYSINLGNYESAKISQSLWAQIEEGEDPAVAEEVLFEMVKANIRREASIIKKGSAKQREKVKVQEYFAGKPIEDF